MEVAIGLTRSMDAAILKHYAKRVEELGFESILVGDHVVLPTGGTNQYPYTADGSFVRPADDPFLETMTLLGFLVACTETIRLGSTVIILPYRNPVVQAKMFSSLDVLSNGRMVCGIGVGWLEKEFDTLGVPYPDRGPMSDEFLEMFKILWTETNPEYHGKYYSFDGIQFYPKPVQQPLPIWVGGHTRRALRRTAKYGHCWHPTRQTPDFVAQNLPYLRQQTEAAGRDPADILISLKRSLHFTDIGLPEVGTTRSTGAVIGTTQEVIDDIYYCKELGVDHLTYDFRVQEPDEYLRIIEHMADRILPVAKDLG